MINFNEKVNLKPFWTLNQIRGTIIFIDSFENVVVNITYTEFEKARNNRNFLLFYKQKEPISLISADYFDVGIGEVLVKFNTEGYLEIAINMGKAASYLNLKVNETIQINFVD